MSWIFFIEYLDERNGVVDDTVDNLLDKYGYRKTCCRRTYLSANPYFEKTLLLYKKTNVVASDS